MLKQYKEYRRKQKVKKAATDAAKVTSGLLIGATAGLLLAPKSGEETRGEILQKKKEAIKKLTHLKDDTVDKIEEKTVEAKYQLKEKKDNLEKKVDAFKKA